MYGHSSEAGPASLIPCIFGLWLTFRLTVSEYSHPRSGRVLSVLSYCNCEGGRIEERNERLRGLHQSELSVTSPQTILDV